MPVLKPPSIFFFAIVFGLSPLLPAATVEERLEELETRLGALSQENEALRQQLGLQPPKNPAVVVTAAGKEKSLSIGGYLQLQAEAGDAPDSRFPANDRFLVRRARITVKGSFVENFDFVFQSEFGNGNLSPVTAYRAQLTDLYVTWNRFDLANVTFGQFKTPYGYEQLLPDTKTLFIERSLPNDRLTLSRQIGAMASGKIAGGRLGYSTGLFNGNGVNNGGNDNEAFLQVGRLEGVIVDTDKFQLTAATNAFQSHDTGSFTGQRTGLGFDIQAQAGRFNLGVDGFRTDFDPDAGADTTAEGWSALTGVYVIKNKLQLLVRYETYDPNGGLSGDDEDLWTLGGNYFLKGNDLMFKLDYLLGDPAGPLSHEGRLLTRMQVIF